MARTGGVALAFLLLFVGLPARAQENDEGADDGEGALDDDDDDSGHYDWNSGHVIDEGDDDDDDDAGGGFTCILMDDYEPADPCMVDPTACVRAQRRELDSEMYVAEPERPMIVLSAIGVAGMVSTDLELEIRSGTRRPSALGGAQLELVGQGWAAGGGMRSAFQLRNGFRFGVALVALHLDDVELEHRALPDGVTVTLESAGALDIDAYIGWAFAAGPVYPYVEVVTSFDMVNAAIAVEGDVLDHADMTAFSFGVTPRLGVFVPVAGAFSIEGGVQGGLFGLETVGGYLGAGAWLPH
jgi:hypothetical protein